MKDTLTEILNRHPKEWRAFQNGADEMSVGNSRMMDELYNHFFSAGEMPYGVAKCRTGDPNQWIFDKLAAYDLGV